MTVVPIMLREGDLCHSHRIYGLTPTNMSKRLLEDSKRPIVVIKRMSTATSFLPTFKINLGRFPTDSVYVINDVLFPPAAPAAEPEP